jgi:hypothetical protein
VRAMTFAVCLGLVPATALAQAPQKLNENCIVSVLNRNTRVRPDGTWVLPNIPANFGLVRARASCIFDGQTVSGESSPFLISPNGSIDVPPIILGPTTPIPLSLTVTTPTPQLGQIGQTAQLTASARYPDGSIRDVAAAGTGTKYVVSNPAIATVTADGLVTALASGTALVQATHEGTAGFVSVRVVLSADSDGDGIPDDLELTLGLNPNNAADAFEDPDRDGLSNRDEAQLGTALRNPDSDGDGIFDGEEATPGADGFVTSPLLADTDGDGVRDALEIASGSDPTNPASLNLNGALKALVVSPTTFSITVNSVLGVGSLQLTVTGHLLDGTTIDLTSTQRGTNYASSDLNVCNFGQPAGRVFGGQPGACTITMTSSGFLAVANGTIANFAPAPLGSLAIPGYANNVDVNGAFAYVAAGSAGLVVVHVGNPSAPVIVAAVDTPGNANDVRVIGNVVYVADGGSGLRIIDVTNPAAPVSLGALDTAGEANDVIVADNLAYVADGAAGVQIINVSNPASPVLVRTVDTPGTARGVDVEGATVVVADDSPALGLRVLDVTNPATAAIVGNVSLTGSIIDVDLNGGFAFVAAYTGGVHIVDVRAPTAPATVANIPGSGPNGFVPRDVQVAGQFALFAEQLFANAVAPIVDIGDPATPFFRGVLDFGQDYAGTGIAVSGPYVYWTGQSFVVSSENGANGTTRLFIGQYISLEDRAGVAPSLTLTQPFDGASVIEGAQLPVRANATDDVAVASVTFLVDGRPVFTDTSEPFEFVFTVPTVTGALAFGARAVDFGNNIAVAAPVTVTVIPDPLTTVTGRVVQDDVPVAGATVAVLSFTGTTASDGTFAISGLPTTRGPLSASVVAVIGGVTLRGRSAAVTPVSGGTTDLGTIAVRRGGRLFGSSSIQGVNPRSIFLIDTETGVPTLVGAPAGALNGISDASFNPVTGVMYAMHGAATRGAELLTLDPATAAVLARVTMTSAIGLAGSDAIAHDASGLLYAGAWSSGRLLTVNPVSGVALTDIPVTAGGGNNHLADLAIDPTTGEVWASRGGSLVGRIVRIDPQTGVVTRILDLVGLVSPEITAIAFDVDGQMYVSVGGDQLARVDKETGAYTLIGTGFGGVKMSGLGFEP